MVESRLENKIQVAMDKVNQALSKQDSRIRNLVYKDKNDAISVKSKSESTHNMSKNQVKDISLQNNSIASKVTSSYK